MAIGDYVEQILNSPVYVFDGIIEKLIGKNLHFAKIELCRHRVEVDGVLLASIRSILKDLSQEEGLFSRFLYAHFGFEIRKNKRREQLIYLGSELKTQHQKIKARLYALHRQKERLSYSIVDLKRLSESVEAKNLFFENDNIKNKSRFYINELKQKIKELEEIQLSLLMRYDELCEIEMVYHKLLKSIPRYELLQEETHLLLATRVKV